MISDSQKFLRINKDGEVLLSSRPTVRASCPMDFRNYPRDKQLCDLEFESCKKLKISQDYPISM